MGGGGPTMLSASSRCARTGRSTAASCRPRGGVIVCACVTSAAVGGWLAVRSLGIVTCVGGGGRRRIPYSVCCELRHVACSIPYRMYGRVGGQRRCALPRLVGRGAAPPPLPSLHARPTYAQYAMPCATPPG